MGSNYIFSLTPTFTQGLVLGQLSILLLLALILKYLFLESGPTSFAQRTSSLSESLEKERVSELNPGVSPESTTFLALDEDDHAAWFNLLLQKIVKTYRSKLRDDLPGADGDEVARRRIERFANKVRPPNFLDPIRVLSVDLGSSSPQISNARIHYPDSPSTHHAKPLIASLAAFDVTYTDSLSVSLATSVLFHYPVPYFIKLPIRLNISLSLFSSKVILTPPDPLSANPTLTISLAPTFTLDLKTRSLVGSRAKLEDVPKLHEMIQAQLRRALAERGTWKVVLPWVADVEEVKEEVAKEDGSNLEEEDY